jgi:acetolactate synthase I/II/III large subunit
VTGATAEAPVLEAADVIIAAGLDTVELIPNPWPYTAPVVALAAWPEDSPYFDPVCEYVADLPATIAAIRPYVKDEWEPGLAAHVHREGMARLLAAPSEPCRGVAPQQVISAARHHLPRGTIATVDAGAHMLVAMPLWTTDEPNEALISSGLATMGFALPAAVAASLARPAQRVICFIGDGGLGMGLAELETLARLRLPVTVVVFNDSTLSLIALKQRPSGHGGRAAVGYQDTNFARIATSMGIAAETVSSPAAFARALERRAGSQAPCLLDVRIDTSAYPEILESIRGTR